MNSPRPARVVLASTYDLGRQPFGLASPAAWLREAGLEVRCMDFAVAAPDEDALRAADAIAFHIPMHTATRLAIAMVPYVRTVNPNARLAFFGLYAGVNEGLLRRLGATGVFAGEYERRLAEWASQSPGGDAFSDPAHGTTAYDPAARSTPDPAAGSVSEPAARSTPDPAAGSVSEPAARSVPDPAWHERLAFRVPDRSDLPGLEHYASLQGLDKGSRKVAYTEASRGCKHLCRHCPVVPVYGGRFRVVPREIVLEDIHRQIAQGAGHVTFGDPDFWNGIGHALPIVRELHREHPSVTYDVTIKIEHLLLHREHLHELRDTGCLFVTSAVESIDDEILERLDKGHTRADFVAALHACRAAGIRMNPTFVAFTPWTTRTGYLELLRSLEELDLIADVAPVQLAIRLLIPAGSMLMEMQDVQRRVGPFDSNLLVHPWVHEDPALDDLQRRVFAVAQRAATAREDRAGTFGRIAQLAHAAAGASGEAPGTLVVPRAPVPFLTEPWYC